MTGSWSGRTGDWLICLLTTEGEGDPIWVPFPDVPVPRTHVGGKAASAKLGFYRENGVVIIRLISTFQKWVVNLEYYLSLKLGR